MIERLTKDLSHLVDATVPVFLAAIVCATTLEGWRRKPELPVAAISSGLLAGYIAGAFGAEDWVLILSAVGGTVIGPAVFVSVYAIGGTLPRSIPEAVELVERLMKAWRGKE